MNSSISHSKILSNPPGRAVNVRYSCISSNALLNADGELRAISPKALEELRLQHTVNKFEFMQKSSIIAEEYADLSVVKQFMLSDKKEHKCYQRGDKVLEIVHRQDMDPTRRFQSRVPEKGRAYLAENRVYRDEREEDERRRQREALRELMAEGESGAQ